MKTFFYGILSSLMLFFAPISQIILLIGIMILIDTFYGRWAAKQIAIKEGKDPRNEVTSKKTRVGFISKFLTYEISIILAFIIDKWAINSIVMSFFPIEFLATKLIGLFIIWIEFTSIDEKIYRVKGYKVFDKFVEFVKKIKNSISCLVDFKRKNL